MQIIVAMWCDDDKWVIEYKSLIFGHIKDSTSSSHLFQFFMAQFLLFDISENIGN